MIEFSAFSVFILNFLTVTFLITVFIYYRGIKKSKPGKKTSIRHVGAIENQCGGGRYKDYYPPDLEKEEEPHISILDKILNSCGKALGNKYIKVIVDLHTIFGLIAFIINVFRVVIYPLFKIIYSYFPG